MSRSASIQLDSSVFCASRASAREVGLSRRLETSRAAIDSSAPGTVTFQMAPLRRPTMDSSLSDRELDGRRYTQPVAVASAS